MPEFNIADEVTIHANVGTHRKNGHTGFVTGTPEDSYWGFYSVAFPGDPSGNYSFLPSELRVASPKDGYPNAD